MAVTLLNGNEAPTAAKMNELWSEADTIFDKAMDGKSTFLLFREKVDANWSPHLFRGKEFWFYTATDHQADDLSVLYPIYDTMPTAHNQSTYDTAVSGATFTTYNSTDYWAQTSADINIDQTLKAHTHPSGGNNYFVWDKGQPAPEKKWRYAVAEIVIGNAASNAFEFADSYDKYNCFKIHNLTGNLITFYFGTVLSSHYSLTIPAYSQKCVRRYSVTSGYDSSYKYLFKCNRNDPRFLSFDSHEGSVAQTMRANNITNASFLYNLMEHIGGDGLTRDDSVQQKHNRIAYDPHVWNDISSDYSTAGCSPSISTSTILAELAFTKGEISYYRAATSSSTPQVGTITFNGFSGFNTILQGIGLNGYDSGNDYRVIRATAYEYFYLWGKTTNLLNYNDQFRTLALGSLVSDPYAILQTAFYYPNFYANPTFIDSYQHSDNGTAYDSTSKDVQDFWDYLDANSNSECTILADSHASGIRSLILTTEGPTALYVDSWKIQNHTTGRLFNSFHGNGFIVSNYYDIIDDGTDCKILVKQYYPIHADRYRSGPGNALRSEYRKGWPSKWTGTAINPLSATTMARYPANDTHKFHRMFEGPKKVRRYETTSGNYPHLEITNDPAGLNGSDFGQNDTATLTDTDVAVQTNDITATVETFTTGDTDVPNYPRMVVNDGAKSLEDAKSTSTTVSELITAASGNANEYCRINLLKEHFNDLVYLLKKANKIRPLCFDEIYFGNERPAQLGHGNSFHVLNNYLAPMDTYGGFYAGSNMETLYGNLGMTPKTEADFPDDIHADSTSGGDQTTLANYRWVTIDDVEAKAAAMGFKFRFEEMATPLKYVGTREFDTTAVEADGKWKFWTAKGVITGSTVLSGMTFVIYTIGTEFFGNTSTSDANRAIKFHLYDTSRTASGSRMKIGFSEMTNAIPDFLGSYTTDEKFLTPPSSGHNYNFAAKVTPPVTHSA